MNLQEIKKFAQEIRLVDVHEKHRHKAQCYRDMIINKIELIDNIVLKMNNYIQDVQEYMGQLKKIEVIPVSEKVEAELPKEEKPLESKPASPLLP